MKIWRYMDLAKFISLLNTRSLYFSCPSEFDDPFEGYLPKSHIEAHSEIMREMLAPVVSLRNELAKKFSSNMLCKIDDKINNISMLEMSKMASSQFGVSCWHKNESESEAMWKLYSVKGHCIAIESTINQLKDSLGSINGLIVDSVRYMNFDNDPIEKGHKHYGLFIKRKAFEHEKELRATIRLEKEGLGRLIKCDLNILITKIHISPLAPGYFVKVIEALCLGGIQSLDKPIIYSKLFNDPDYGVKGEIST